VRLHRVDPPVENDAVVRRGDRNGAVLRGRPVRLLDDERSGREATQREPTPLLLTAGRPVLGTQSGERREPPGAKPVRLAATTRKPLDLSAVERQERRGRGRDRH